VSAEETLLFDDEALTAARNRRMKVLAGVGALSAMAVISGSAFLFTGAPSPTTDEPVGQALAAAVTPETPFDEGEPEAAPGDDAATPERTSEIFSSKNPFTPLVEAAPAAPVDDTGSPAPAVVGSTEPVTIAPTAGPATAATGQTVGLNDLHDAGGKLVATVKVGETTHVAGEGETFADRFLVVSLSQEVRCGQFLFGDEPFRLCVGDQIVK
jgi:hypothetical protein